jgi:hypothetical protein
MKQSKAMEHGGQKASPDVLKLRSVCVCVCVCIYIYVHTYKFT